MANARSWLPYGLFLASCGCVHQSNDRLTLGGHQASPSLTPHHISIDPKSPELLADRISVDRRSWVPVQFVVPFDGVVHGQTLRIEPPLHPESSPRYYGRYPSPADVLSAQRRGWIQDILFSCGELGRSIVGTPLGVAFLAWRGDLDEPSISPRPYKRTQQNGWSTGLPAPTAPDGGINDD